MKDLILLLKKWKQYTDILGLTSAEIFKMISEKNSEVNINKRKKMMEKDIEKKKEKTFVDAVEEDTEDEEITLATFI